MKLLHHLAVRKAMASPFDNFCGFHKEVVRNDCRKSIIPPNPHRLGVRNPALLELE